jgi:hypothetical protein
VSATGTKLGLRQRTAAGPGSDLRNFAAEKLELTCLATLRTNRSVSDLVREASDARMELLLIEVEPALAQNREADVNDRENKEQGTRRP